MPPLSRLVRASAAPLLLLALTSGILAGAPRASAVDGTLQLIAATDTDYVAVVGDATAYPGAEVQHFPTLAQAEAAARQWTVVERDDGAFQLQLTRSSGTKACLIPHSHSIGGTQRPVTITTYCDATQPEQFLRADGGALSFASVPSYELAGAYLGPGTVQSDGKEYLTRSAGAPGVSWTWLGLPGEAAPEVTAQWVFQPRIEQPSLLTGSTLPGAAVRIRDSDGQDVVPPITAAADGGFATEIPAPDRGGVYDLAITAEAPGHPEATTQVSLDYGPGVEVDAPTDSASASDGRASRDSSARAAV